MDNNYKCKKFFIYDVEEKYEKFFLDKEKDFLSFSANPMVNNCVGCFGCWIKTPGKCLINDRCQIIPEYLSKCDELIVVSPIKYGSYSPEIKAVLERSIGYMLPYFRIINNEMHHKQRYKKTFSIKFLLYGKCDKEEIEIAKKLIKANALNFGTDNYFIDFFDSFENIKEKLI